MCPEEKIKELKKHRLAISKMIDRQISKTVTYNLTNVIRHIDYSITHWDRIKRGSGKVFKPTPLPFK